MGCGSTVQRLSKQVWDLRFNSQNCKKKKKKLHKIKIKKTQTMLGGGGF